MIYYDKEFDSKEEAEQFIEYIMRSYHPAGYGTIFKSIKQSGDKWIVSGSRYSSCD